MVCLADVRSGTHRGCSAFQLENGWVPSHESCCTGLLGSRIRVVEVKELDVHDTSFERGVDGARPMLQIWKSLLVRRREWARPGKRPGILEVRQAGFHLAVRKRRTLPLRTRWLHEIVSDRSWPDEPRIFASAWYLAGAAASQRQL